MRGRDREKKIERQRERKEGKEKQRLPLQKNKQTERVRKEERGDQLVSAGRVCVGDWKWVELVS